MLSSLFFPYYFSLQERRKGGTKKINEAEAKLSAQGQNDSMKEQIPDPVSRSVLTFYVQFLRKIMIESSSFI